MAGRKKDHSSFAAESVMLAKKIACHANADPTGGKFLKYMRHVSVVRKGASTSRNRSLWTELKNNGALTSIMEALQKVLVSEDIQKLTVIDNNGGSKNLSKDERDRKDRIVGICNAGFSILSNAFALDYAVRSEAVDNGFISSLQKFIANFTQDVYVTFKNAELISRAVKCTANISNDSNCREIVLRNGVAISILRILDKADEKMSSDNSNCDGNAFVDREEISQLICACMRAVRIMASDSKYLTNNGRDHLIKFGGLISVINTLTWEAKLTTNEDFVLDVIRGLTFLSVRIRSAPFDVVQTLIYNPENSKVRCLVRLFENTLPDSKLHSPLVNCLINFTTNKEISDCIGALRIFPIILSKLSDVTDEEHYHDLIKLLIALTKHSSFNQSHLATSPLIGSTLKILKSSRFKDYHEWLLMVYEKLYEVSLSKLVQCDLVNHLCDLFREELEECDYDSIRKKISSLDEAKCSVHCDEEVCPFVPAYRCSSPSYKQIQEEMKSRYFLDDDEYTNKPPFLKNGEDSLSPLSSPAHSLTSGGSSPVHSDISSGSYSLSSDDDGCYGMEAHSPVADSSDEKDRDETATDPDDNPMEPPAKRLKFENSSSKNNFSSPRITHDCQAKRKKSLDELKGSAKKIVGILNILFKCAHVKPFPESLLNLTPIFLGIILRGKVSLMPQGVEYQTDPKDNELHELSRRTFEITYKILLKICSVSQIFPEIIKSGMIPILHRLQEPFTSTAKNSEQVAVVRKYCENIISKMIGLENDTAGWREGFIMRAVLVNNSNICKENMEQMIVNIPLLYQNHVSVLRKFEKKVRSFTKILDILKDSDDASFYRFEDCALALCSICSALGVKWEPLAKSVPLLLNTLLRKDSSKVIIMNFPKSDSSETLNFDETERVKLVLDDGTVFSVDKGLLVDASPVFSAMFNGSFIEADEQKVHLPNVSKTSVEILLNQVLELNDFNSTNNDASQTTKDRGRNTFDLTSIFELLTLADRFILEDVYERALNTLISKYLCPYSAPMVYAESVKLANVQKSGCNQSLGDRSLSLMILKYILTADTIRMSERCNAIRKVFDSVVPEHVVKDLKTLIDDHMYKCV